MKRASACIGGCLLAICTYLLLFHFTSLNLHHIIAGSWRTVTLRSFRTSASHVVSINVSLTSGGERSVYVTPSVMSVSPDGGDVSTKTVSVLSPLALSSSSRVNDSGSNSQLSTLLSVASFCSFSSQPKTRKSSPSQSNTRVSSVAPVEELTDSNAITLLNNISFTSRSLRKSERWIINEPNVCKRGKVTLLVIVCTGVDHFSTRKAVRDTWGNKKLLEPWHARIVFLIGRSFDQDLQQRVEAESQASRDIVQANFVDSYRNLTLKSIAALEWAREFCGSRAYLLKSDDDMFIHVPNLLKSLRMRGTGRFIMGSSQYNAVADRDTGSKWYVTLEEFGGRTYPLYCSGTAYAISGAAIDPLYEAATKQKPFWLEDVFITGILAVSAGIPRVHNPGFTYRKRVNDPCLFRSIISAHRMNATELRSMWKLSQAAVC